MNTFQETITHLQDPDGFTVTLGSVGAGIRQTLVPVGEHSPLRNIALSFSNPFCWRENPLYAGATLAPTAGRISDGHLPVHEKVFQLTRNENEVHTLHGGSRNISFRSFDVLCSENAVTFRTSLADGVDGFPGNRSFSVSYELLPQHTLLIHLKAVSDQDTYVNMSNHTYFNLTGDFSRPATDHDLRIRASHVLPCRDDFIPTGQLLPVSGTVFDFRESRRIDALMATDPENEQILSGRGYNHAFVLDHHPDFPSKVQPEIQKLTEQTDLQHTAEQKDIPHISEQKDIPHISEQNNVPRVSGQNDVPRVSGQDNIQYLTGLLASDPDILLQSPDTAVSLAGVSDAPCVVFYSGGYIDKDPVEGFCPSCALALEFQDYPDAPGGHGFPYPILKAGEVWHRNILWQIRA